MALAFILAAVNTRRTDSGMSLFCCSPGLSVMEPSPFAQRSRKSLAHPQWRS